MCVSGGGPVALGECIVDSGQYQHQHARRGLQCVSPDVGPVALGESVWWIAPACGVTITVYVSCGRSCSSGREESGQCLHVG